ncbi:MAG: porin [Proteobacteria bacterium]|nr:porin [Pseudomonadota bacterium]MDA1331482.1 porin [Pseudomonadota bacterium]
MFTKSNKALIATAVAGALFSMTGSVAANNALIDKLFDKGVINDAEYQEIKAVKGDPESVKAKYKGGFSWETLDGKNKFAIQGRIQQDFYDYDHDLEKDTFDTRRVYIGVKATIDEVWGLEATMNPDSNKLEYAYIDFKPSKAFTARFGQQKFLSGYEEGTSSRFIDFTERSLADGLQPGKQVGVQVFGEPVKNTFFYAIGIYNGEGLNTNESDALRDQKDTMFTVAYNAAAALGAGKDSIAHIGFSRSQGARDYPSTGILFTIDGEAAGDDFGSWTLANGPSSFDRQHSNLSFVAAKGPFKLQGEATEVTVDTSSISETVEATYMALTYMLTGEHYAKSYSMTGRKATKPNAPYSKAGGKGAWELGFRTSQWDATDVATSNYTGSKDVRSTTFGVKFIPHEKVRFLLNFVNTQYDTPIVAAEGNENAVILRSQIDW